MKDKPSVGLSINYRKQGRTLEAVELLRIDSSADELLFLIRAWKAAFQGGWEIVGPPSAAAADRRLVV